MSRYMPPARPTIEEFNNVNSKFEKSTNLFNNNDILLNTRIDLTSRQEEYSDYYWSTFFIEVKPNTNYAVISFQRVIEYDGNKNWIKGRAISNPDEQTIITTKTNTKYLRFSAASVSDIKIAQINEGDELLPYEPYYIKLTDEVNISGIGSVLNIFIPFESSGINHSTGMINPSSILDHETSRRTGKFLNVLPLSSLSVNFDKGNLFVFEYDSTFTLLKSSEVTNGGTMLLSANTNYVKFSIENLVNTDFPSCAITFKSPTPFANWIKNPRFNANNITFIYEVNTNEGREILVSDSIAEQYTAERYHNSGILKLPPNYDPNGEPVKLIIFHAGAGGYSSFSATTFGNQYEDYFQYLVDEGYAMLSVYTWTTKYPETPHPNFGSPISMSAYVQGYKWVTDNYNIDTNGAYIAGKSAGGYTGLNLIYNKGIPILAAGLLAPAISPLVRVYGYDEGSRLSYADDFGFEGDNSVLSSEVRTEELKNYIKNNAEKMVGYNPFWNGIVCQNLTDLATYGAENVEGDPENFMSVSRISTVPQKIWVSEDDEVVPVGIIKNYIKTIKNGQGIGELRLMPNGTGGHHSVDTDTNAMKVSSIKTRLGITHTNIPLAYVELLQFFRRYEN